MSADDAVPEAVRRHPEFAKVMTSLDPELRADLCEFFRHYEKLTVAERADVMREIVRLKAAH